MLSQNLINKIDANNTKALTAASITLTMLENGENVDVASILEVICDYLKANNDIFNNHL